MQAWSQVLEMSTVVLDTHRSFYFDASKFKEDIVWRCILDFLLRLKARATTEVVFKLPNTIAARWLLKVSNLKCW